MIFLLESHLTLIFLFEILGLTKEKKSNNENDNSNELIKLLIKIRNQARLNKDYETSDQIRNDLEKLGIKINDEETDSTYNFI